MKDPRDENERPYEVLGVSPDISVKDAERVYTDFLRDRKNVSRRQAARVAYDRLRRIEWRVEDEIFYYPSAPTAAEGLRGQTVQPFSHEPVPPDLTIDVVAMAQRWPVGEQDFDPFSPRRVQLSDTSSFEERLLRCLPIEFPS